MKKEKEIKKQFTVELRRNSSIQDFSDVEQRNGSIKVIPNKDDSFYKNENEEFKSVTKQRVHHLTINSKKPPLMRVPTKDNLHHPKNDKTESTNNNVDAQTD